MRQAAGLGEWGEAIHRRYGRSPLHAHLGLTLVEVGDGTATLAMRVKPEFINAHGGVHGGMIASGLDSCLFQSILTRCAEADRLSTVELKVNFLEPACTPVLTFKGRAARVGGSLGVAHADAFAEDGTLVATALGTIAIRRQR